MNYSTIYISLFKISYLPICAPGETDSWPNEGPNVRTLDNPNLFMCIDMLDTLTTGDDDLLKRLDLRSKLTNALSRSGNNDWLAMDLFAWL